MSRRKVEEGILLPIRQDPADDTLSRDIYSVTDAFHTLDIGTVDNKTQDVKIWIQGFFGH